MTDKTEEIKALLDQDMHVQDLHEKLDELIPAGCQRRYFKKSEYDESCTAKSGSPFKEKNCVEITNCPDSSDNRTVCGEWRCVSR